MVLPIEGQARPNNIRQEFSVTTPDGYVIEVEEIGVTQTNPIVANTWDKSNRQILWSSDVALSIDVAPGKVTKIPNVNPPNPGTFNYNYLLLKNNVKIKANAKFASGSAPNGWYTTSNPDLVNVGSANSADYDFYTEILKNFGERGQPFEAYIDLNPDFNVQGLLLEGDKITTARITGAAPNPLVYTAEYILAVFDTSSPLVITKNSKLTIKFNSSNRVIVYAAPGGAEGGEPAHEEEWRDSTTPAAFATLPFAFEVVSS